MQKKPLERQATLANVYDSYDNSHMYPQIHEEKENFQQNVQRFSSIQQMQVDINTMNINNNNNNNNNNNVHFQKQPSQYNIQAPVNPFYGAPSAPLSDN